MTATDRPSRTEGPRVFLIRHADASGGPKDPERGRPLSDLGRRQAAALARRIARWQLDAIFSSDMHRTVGQWHFPVDSDADAGDGDD